MIFGTARVNHIASGSSCGAPNLAAENLFLTYRPSKCITVYQCNFWRGQQNSSV